MRILKISVLLLAGFFPASLWATDAPTPTFASLCPDTVEGDIKKTCDEIRAAQAALLLRNAKVENALAGITQVTGKAGTTAYSDVSGTGKAGGYATILAVNTVTRAGYSMGQDICASVPGANIYFGSPEEFREATFEKQRYLRLYDMEKKRAARLTAEFHHLTGVMENFISLNSAPSSSGTGAVRPFSAMGVIPDVTALATVLASSVDHLTKLVRSDVTITAYSVEIPDGTLETAVKGGIIRASHSGRHCRIFSPEKILTHHNPFETAATNLARQVDQLIAAADKLNLKISESILTNPSKPSEFEALLKLRQTHLQQTNAIVEASQERERALWDNVMSPVIAEGIRVGPSLSDRITTANAVQRDPSAVFVDVEVVEAAAASVNSSGLFRTDRMHFQGNVVTKFEIIARNGQTLGSGFRDVALADLVRDRVGFKSHERTYEQPLQDRRLTQESSARNGLHQYEGGDR